MQSWLANIKSVAVLLLAVSLFTLSFALLIYTYFEHKDRPVQPQQKVITEKTQPEAEADKEVFVVHMRNGKQTKLLAYSQRISEGEIQLKVTGQNFRQTPTIEKWRPLSQNDKDPIVILDPVDPKVPYDFSYSFTSHPGTSTAKPDEKFQYNLPFEKDKKFQILQGYFGKTHSVENQDEYAIDLDFPEGTMVCAARDGVVVAYRDDSTSGGSDKSFLKEANYVTIKHADGSLGNYAHLRRNGVLAKLGSKVTAGQAIGLSGNTGMSTGPHLHFEVSYYDLEHTRHSLPLTLKTANGLVSKPKVGMILAHPKSAN